MTTAIESFLNLFPGLLKYESEQDPEKVKNTYDFDDIIMRFCHILDTEDPALLIEGCCKEIEYLIVAKTPIYDLIQDIEAQFTKAKTSFNQILSMVAEQAILSGKIEKLGSLIEHLGNKSKHPVYQFLDAWIKFNLGQLNACIKACKKAEAKFGPILGLMGQAYIETQKPSEAVEVLKDATELMPSDILTWYLLAKALLQFNDPDQAYQAGEQCLFLNPLSFESLDLLIEISKHERISLPLKSKTLQRIIKEIEENQSRPQLFIEGLNFSFELQDQKSAFRLIESANFIHLMRSAEFRSNLGQMLERLSKPEWTKVQLAFIDRTKEGTDRLSKLLA